MEPTEKFLRRNLGISGPEDYIKLYDGTIVPMSESGEQFAYSERITECNVFCIGAFLGAIKASIVSNQIAKTIVPKAGSVDFYVKPNGDVVPSKGYRYVSSKAEYLPEINKSMVIPENNKGTYFSFDKFDIASPSKLQVPHDASIRLEFDTLQIIDNIRIPNGKWDTADYLEPITKDFKIYGKGGATQVITNESIKLDKIINLGE